MSFNLLRTILITAGLVLSLCLPETSNADFGLQGGPNAFSAVVSNSADPLNPAVANPNDLSTQAGAHPFDVTTSFMLNPDGSGIISGAVSAKDVFVSLPAGFSGSAATVPRCRMDQLATVVNAIFTNPATGCPVTTQVGTVTTYFDFGGSITTLGSFAPVYNMVPPPGVTAQFAFQLIVLGQPVTVKVRTDGDYGLVAETPNISETLPLIGSTLTLWGVPADPRHDAQRFLPANGAANFNFGAPPGDASGNPIPAGLSPTPYLSNPTMCGTPLYATIAADAWTKPGRLNADDGRPDLSDPNWVTAGTPMYPQGLTGCERLRFEPNIGVKFDNPVADSPSGLTVDLSVPQSSDAEGLATPPLKDTMVALPPGVAMSPSAASNGLQGCSAAQIALGSDKEPTCPDASQIGTVRLTSPLLPDTLQGQIYLGSERSGSTYRMYLVSRGDGVLLKLGGTISTDEATGQLTSTFTDNPPLQFSELQLHFFGGPSAALATPESCGTYAVQSSLAPWSGTQPATPSDAFTIGTGCGGDFSPAFIAGTASNQAGSFSPFILSLARTDTNRELSTLRLALPSGLIARLTGIPLCPDESASVGACPAASRVGTIQTAAGTGPHPLLLSGKVYLTGPYKGSPFGLVVVVPAMAGPFDLGNVIVRQSLGIDPTDANVTVVSDPLPRILDGIPLRLKGIEVSLDRPEFILNPTNCEPTAVNGSIVSIQGVEANVSSRFQAAECQGLSFNPSLSALTTAKTSRAKGASLHVVVRSSQGQANIKSVRVVLPKQLPSRLSTLNHACPEAQFHANPAGCPAASVIGSATAHTPVLPVPLKGPAYFVSHGGAAFPDLVMVLQGYGVTIELTGSTFISKAGVVTSTFGSVPDVPVTRFDLVLPQGPHSALASNGSNLCRGNLVMPTTIVGQNGARVKRNVKIPVAGCHPSKRHRRRAAGKGRARGR